LIKKDVILKYVVIKIYKEGNQRTSKTLLDLGPCTSKEKSKIFG